ncbi:DUF3253 domain-containing protein [Arthrobacter woluwensis]|uniref:DUF3253 domain-containing protein n=1 Tax=Arthrobacter woluwensis TaxID=156980 RepID=UPI0037F4ADAE
MSKGQPEQTADGHYIVVDGRRWRASDPSIPESLRQELVNELMAARRAVKMGDEDARSRVSDAKVSLGERGAAWWETPADKDRELRIIATANSLLRHRGDKSICPSDIARVVGGDNWRDLMEPVRNAIANEAAADRMRITQRGRTVEISEARGPIRICKGVKFPGSASDV